MAHDTTIRFTHELRMTLRELGSRRVAADLIDTVDDVYYLTCDELVTMPADARLRVKRRRTERERLQAQPPPDVIDHTWKPRTKSAKSAMSRPALRPTAMRDQPTCRRRPELSIGSELSRRRARPKC
ncbi:hypothetical protein NIIDMKKI_34280 [Mycobacterium kansasii]|uniref:Uncharacterized protein n=1 Tax=Mycobacterium kansasii TaxID=1768 RepID=A0A7G1IEA7_MYCKA|nr:hypothetical protein NIIDMKKI_34280 [Mycobacterium kansasii]